MNVLSGATWEGAKLGIGEAKRNYRERKHSSRRTNRLRCPFPATTFQANDKASPLLRVQGKQWILSPQKPFNRTNAPARNSHPAAGFFGQRVCGLITLTTLFDSRFVAEGKGWVEGEGEDGQEEGSDAEGQVVFGTSEGGIDWGNGVPEEGGGGGGGSQGESGAIEGIDEDGSEDGRT
ncbi:hypothetical protein JAAARDRAFT_51452 [Jaapia argillacea MUCL 33604]|uniref:Uncharacterized protein n=1 Tax=Jaapia argillacea MUCL 33604 TaxID=933084 RepID=A0A067P8C3_9AGAM|nr:hypothetical protein JAAARDRAFT_51452 [Jaapia argillacea MUCL 33604]